MPDLNMTSITNFLFSNFFRYLIVSNTNKYKDYLSAYHQIESSEADNLLKTTFNTTISKNHTHITFHSTIDYGSKNHTIEYKFGVIKSLENYDGIQLQTLVTNPKKNIIKFEDYVPRLQYTAPWAETNTTEILEFSKVCIYYTIFV